jgi:hypothetical protein
MHGRTWLKENWAKRGLDPQRTRVIDNPQIFKGLTEFHVIFLPGWEKRVNAKELVWEYNSRKTPDRKITEEHL